MADVTVHKPANVTVEVIDGDPPADQSVLVTQLQSQVTQLTAERDAAVADANSKQSKIDAARAAAQADKDADAANAAGQGVLDALA